ncbi:peptidase family m20/M25/M40 domain-containing protein [Sarocladium implicatum]|nr:peptidase family m20/M25/M40 domain-containing protein [Sarocladium implicatum]
MADPLPIQSVKDGIREHRDRLWSMNSTIYSNPELGYEETIAHDAITAVLEAAGFSVKRHAYGIATSFEAEYGTGGRLVIFCAEYDALPDIGHACGHNLIATSSVAGFLGLARALKKSRLPGRIRILGTPAEEGGGGKVKLLEAGAFSGDVAAAIMMHPTSSHVIPSSIRGVAGVKFVASLKTRVEFHGRPAHAGGAPWEGRNALDAAVAAYTSVSMLRQQIHPDERIHGVIEDGGKSPNVIPSHTRMNWYIRSPTVARGSELLARVKSCFEAAATATGCTVTYNQAPTYKDLRINNTLSAEYAKLMRGLGVTFVPRSEEPFTFSTDMGNVSYAVPSFHGAFGIPGSEGALPHQPNFAKAARGEDSFDIALSCAEGMALLGWRVLSCGEVATGARRDFETLE